MTDATKVWIDPNDCGLTTVEAADRERKQEEARKRREEAERQQREAERKRQDEERQRREAERKQKKEAERLRQAKAREEALRRKEEERPKTLAPKPEILPPSRSSLLAKADSRSLMLPELDQEALALPDLSHLEREIKSAAKSMDLSMPEGWRDAWFGRENHRIAVKSERGRLLAGYIAACTAILVEAEKAVAAAAALQRAKYELHIDRIRAARAALEEQQKLEAVAINIELQRSLIEAKVKADIAAYAEMTERSKRAMLPPPPPPPPVDEATCKREEARQLRQEKQEVHLDELAEKASFEQEIVTRARKEALNVYHEEDMEAGERFERIRKILESYSLPATILPLAVREFMEEEQEAL